MVLFLKLLTLFNIIILGSALLGVGFHRLLERLPFNFSPKSGLKVQYGLLVGAFTVTLLSVPVVQGWVSWGSPLEQWWVRTAEPRTVQLADRSGVTKATTFRFNTFELANPQGVGPVVQSSRRALRHVSLRWVGMGFLFLVLLRLGLLGWRYGRTLQFLRQGTLLRRVGRLQVLAFHDLQSPIAFSGLRSSVIGLPFSVLLEPSHLRMSLKHELSHLRWRDPQVSLFLEIVKCLSLLPFVFKHWVGLIELLQEMRVDQDLIENQKVNKKEYGLCLLQVAQNVQPMKSFLVGATGMGLHLSNKQLSRRMVKMKQQYVNLNKKALVGFVCASAISLTALAAGVGSGLASTKIQSEQIEKSRFTKGFPVDVNPQVLAQLQRYTQSEKGKAFSIKALANYETQKQVIDDLFMIMDMPKELKAVAFVESGFRNLDEGKNPYRSAGIWQFIPSTARTYNMEVSADFDDRRDVAIQTAAALSYFRKLYRQFGDWRLALMAYNMGEKRLEKGIQKTGTRDPWMLMDQGIQGDLNYLPKVQAAMILMEHPELLH